MGVGIHLCPPRVPLLLGASDNLSQNLRIGERSTRGVVIAVITKLQIAMDFHLSQRCCLRDEEIQVLWHFHVLNATPESVRVGQIAWLSSHLESNLLGARRHHGLRGSCAKAQHLEVVGQLNVHLMVPRHQKHGRPVIPELTIVVPANLRLVQLIEFFLQLRTCCSGWNNNHIWPKVHGTPGALWMSLGTFMPLPLLEWPKLLLLLARTSRVLEQASCIIGIWHSTTCITCAGVSSTSHRLGR
mmetsp:Transcript_52293/g.83486  ORF Transcript_52293/g.83486 Transcript_52293/m.83486 type:complete len:243 (-) Transcript_52293:96-824(-)